MLFFCCFKVWTGDGAESGQSDFGPRYRRSSPLTSTGFVSVSRVNPLNFPNDPVEISDEQLNISN